MNIRILSDGKQGHLNQSLGLAQALVAKAGGAVEIVELQGLSTLGKSARSSPGTTSRGPICSLPPGTPRIFRSSAHASTSKQKPCCA